MVRNDPGCPHVLCRPLHAAAVLLALASGIAIALTSISAFVTVVVFGSLITVIVRLGWGRDLTDVDSPHGLRPVVREAWCAVAVLYDLLLCVCAFTLSRGAFHHPGRLAHVVVLGWDVRSGVFVTTTVLCALSWQVIHLQGMRPARRRPLPVRTKVR